MEEKLRNLRKASGYTQEELSTRINVSRQTISNWERGYSTPDAENLKIISEFYNVPIGYFIDDFTHMVHSPQAENDSINNQEFYFLLLVAIASLFTPLAAFILIYLTLEFKNKLNLKIYHRFLYIGVFLSILNIMVILAVGADLIISLIYNYLS
ncbi:hypothetical protein BAU15_10495 [Enterococcus sp. JM4C]|uniref:helix-turn-helix domain-containing protein n=1 Tax=Candidatus Enterococcus huntleyi TaxID=1857217 RepID=UPI001379D92D|nr:helix-turn-helix transcriptional regulator [Enterococcus sp. JM4C]KAF1296206.1 hypothetical protein BAU15_10495 [Enterococcus sp. JM4C]